MSFEPCLEAETFTIIPSIGFQRKKFLNIETNTDPWNPECQKCLERQKLLESSFSSERSNEYMKALSYINSIHNLINLSASKELQKCGESPSSCSGYGLPDIPNFLSIFANLNPSIKQIEMVSKSTSTESLSTNIKLAKSPVKEKVGNLNKKKHDEIVTCTKNYQTYSNNRDDVIRRTMEDNSEQLVKGISLLTHSENNDTKTYKELLPETASNKKGKRKIIEKFFSEEKLDGFTKKLLSRSTMSQFTKEQLEKVLDNKYIVDGKCQIQNYPEFVEELRKKEKHRQKTKREKKGKEINDASRNYSEAVLVNNNNHLKASDTSARCYHHECKSSLVLTSDYSTTKESNVDDFSEKGGRKKIKIKRSILKTMLHAKPSLIRLHDVKNHRRLNPPEVKPRNGLSTILNERKLQTFGSQLPIIVSEKNGLSDSDIEEDDFNEKELQANCSSFKKPKDFCPRMSDATRPKTLSNTKYFMNDCQLSSFVSNVSSSCSSDILSDNDLRTSITKNEQFKK